MDNLKNKDMEEAVLSAVVCNDETYFQIADIFSIDLFTNSDYQNLAKVIIQLKNESLKVDLLTVSDRMKKSDYFNVRFGIYEITQLSNKINATNIIEIKEHCLILKQYQMKRKIVEIANKMIASATAYNSDVFDVIDEADKCITEITSAIVSTKIETPVELQKQALEHNDKILALKGGLSGITTGFRKIDELTGGWQNTKLIVIAGATSMGKSALVLDFLIAAAYAKVKVGMFSMEMSNLELWHRVQSKVSGIDLERITQIGLNNTEQRQLNLSMQSISRNDLYFDDTEGITIFQLRNKARMLQKKHGIQFLIVDYLQLMAGKQNTNREQEIASISRGLKGIAKELSIPVMVLSQLSRKIEERSDKEPKLSDLRESGAIEQDADMVGFIFRPEYYGITEIDGKSLIGKAKFLIKKNRQGRKGEVDLDWIGRLTKFKSEGIDEPTPLPPLKESTDFFEQTQDITR
jgi:replicative DNA helicase